MIAGLPVATWILFAAAVGLGLGIELRFIGRHRANRTGGSRGGHGG